LYTGKGEDPVGKPSTNGFSFVGLAFLILSIIYEAVQFPASIWSFLMMTLIAEFLNVIYQLLILVLFCV
jgi:hypothetical protein